MRVCVCVCLCESVWLCCVCVRMCVLCESVFV